tara:strand:- start:1011 stop:1442 length:432 start_codon:yes stop_codon:yes gene_type:complete
MKDCNMESLDNDFIQKITDSKWLNYLKGIIASSVHIFIITSFFWVAVLSFNLKTLWIFLFGTYVIIAINISLHNCPISQIEEETLGMSVVDIFHRYLPINYSRDRKYEVQLQHLWVCSGVIGAKIMFYYIKDDMKNFFSIKYT